jgi:orotate phosphoribosyltransferase
MDIAAQVASKLLQINAIKLSPQKPFTWASGIQSPIYCDNRVLLSYPEVRNFIKQSLVQASESFKGFNLIAGVATAGIPHGALLADALQLPFIYVRSKAKEHGRQNLIEGHAPEGSKALVIEDLISTGGSSLQAVQALRDAGVEVLGVLALFSYGFERARQAFLEANCQLLTLSDYDVLIAEARRAAYINEDELNSLQQWRAQTDAVA